MKAEQLAHFKQQLLSQRDSLMASQEQARSATDPVELDQSSVGRVSRVDAMQSQSMAIEATRLRQQHLRQITTALALIESGDYGYCEQCDNEIDPRRLAIEPAATRCVRCASQQE